MIKKILIVGAIAIFLFVGPFAAQASAAPFDAQAAVTNAQTAADTGFILMSSALVLLMTPGLAFFYGGFVRERNILNTLMMSFLLMGIVGVTWVLWGYSLSFAPGLPFIGGLEWLGLNNVGLETTGYLQGSAPTEVVSYAPTIPHQAFMIYQAMFAIITPALISGAIVERVSFRAYALFVLIWSTVIYCPLAHMVWAKGGLLGLYGGIGALDFAGGTVVHISSGVSALVAAIVIGPRKSFPSQLTAPHNVPFILLGAGLLWFGWFGFNAGSALASGGLATVAFVATNTAAAAAALTWLILEKVLRGKPTAVGAATGAVAGLVGITPAAGFVPPLAAILIGSITAVCCFYAISFKHKIQIDDSLDTFPVHGVGGTVGAILTGIFATVEVNSAGKDGLLRGNPGQLVTQIIAIVIAYIIAGVGTFVILKLLDATVGLRLTAEEEFQGMDINEHGEEGYGEEFAGGLSLKREYE
ncbi:ammonium transporter [Aliterella atlantica]|uniref:Ammonium transporter n=1 Tax=Aliterella atlantica CENA595 TaxID=1618023 RepID=A0A0D8ZUC2_9CYAN|nr:ammonium transporter [Aliterella atlantica]KJH72320.1 ammonia channel protein [Aliterella atlantica CENA595]